MSDLTGCLISEYPCQLYLRVQRAIIVFEDGRYSEATDQLMAIITANANMFLHPTPHEPTLDEPGRRLDGLTDTFTEVRHYEASEDTLTD